MARLGVVHSLQLWMKMEKRLTENYHPGTIRLTNRNFTVDINYTWCFDKHKIIRFVGLRFHGHSYKFDNVTGVINWIYVYGRMAYKYSNISHVTKYLFISSKPKLFITSLGVIDLLELNIYYDMNIRIDFTRDRVNYYRIYNVNDTDVTVIHKKHLQRVEKTEVMSDLYNSCIELIYKLCI